MSRTRHDFWDFSPFKPEWHYLTNHPEIQTTRREPVQVAAGARQETEVLVKARRRKWSAEDKERILTEVEYLSGEPLAAVLRREGLYVHTLNKWSPQRDLMSIAMRVCSVG